MTVEDILDEIREAWPPEATPFRIVDAYEGDEPRLLAEEFASGPRWDSLEPEFLDSTPDGYGSALSFFGQEAFRYYIAAFMKADLEESLERVDPVFALTYGLSDAVRNEPVNPMRFGEQTWFHVKQAGFSLFDKRQVACIVHFLEFKESRCEFPDDAAEIRQALLNYWKPRVKELESL